METRSRTDTNRRWEKKGLIYSPAGNELWSISHAQLPFAINVGEDTWRIYFGTRDSANRTLPTFIEVAESDPQRILYVHNQPIMTLGRLGSFDDSGVMPSWIVEHEGTRYLYYIGWNTGKTVPYRNSIGLAISEDEGRSFERLYEGPIMDRTKTEPHFCAAPCVLIENGIWRMWYLSCVKWVLYKGVAEPFYHIKYAESPDGINWRREGIVCIDFNSPDEAGLVRSSVIKGNGFYMMWYSRRNYRDYRTNRRNSYRIGYAESLDGIEWIRKDEIAGIDVSENGWDSEMIAYPHVFENRGRKYMIYNGNGFGRSGFGYAVLDKR